MSMAVPTVHLNGSGKAGLCAPLREAYLAIGHAIEALRPTAPHMRDYYVQDDGDAAFEQAREEHWARVRALEAVQAELLDLHAAIDTQGRNP